MAFNLPSPLSHEQATLLRETIRNAVMTFCRVEGTDILLTQREAGFVMAHLAAQAGVTNVNYLEWLTAPRATDEVPSADPTHNTTQPTDRAHTTCRRL